MAQTEFPHQKIGIRGRWQMVKLNDISDGEPRYWPGRPLYRPSSDENYLIGLATAWMKDQGKEQPGTSYYLENLPSGYGMFEQDQPGGTQVYKRLFGHPSGRFYDSMVRFQVHFLWLMNGMQGNCPCVLCSKGSDKPIIKRTRTPRDTIDISLLDLTRKPRNLVVGEDDSSTRDSSATGIAINRARRDVKQSGAPYAVDAEGTEDVFKLFVRRLDSSKTSKKGIDEDIREANSIDWRSLHEYDGYGENLLSHFFTQIEQQHSFIPRVGELVLWCPNIPDRHYLMFDNIKSEFKFYSFDEKRYTGFPAWRAGAITEVPSASALNGSVDFSDLLNTPNKKTALNTAGFRIETFPDPNEDLDKSLSKQYRFIPLQNIRPLSHWQQLLHGIPEELLHSSVKNALTCMTSISLVEKFKATGSWPHASIHCKGVFLGSELITVGDTVRLAPSEARSKTCQNVLIVESIRLHLIDVKPEHILPTHPLLSSQVLISLIGRAYSLDIRNHWQVQQVTDATEDLYLPSPISLAEVKTFFRPVGTAEYGSWYPMHSPLKRYEVSHDQVLGRMYEADAIRLWTGQLQHKVNGVKPRPELGFDIQSIASARVYASQTDTRLPEPTKNEISWFWADTRAEALAIETFNGLEVGNYHHVRDQETLGLWQSQIRLLNGQPMTTTEVTNYTAIVSRRGRPPGSKLVDGKLVKPGDPEWEEFFGEGMEGSSQSRPKPNSQMAGAALVSTDEEDLEEDETVVIAADGIGENNQEPPPRRIINTKEQIMTGAMMENNEDYYYYSSEFSENEPPPPMRGGTEESEGGDYGRKQKIRAKSAAADKKSKKSIANHNR